jgi:hypothetical protein
MPSVFVGEPGSIPFEQARLSGRFRACYSYEESALRLRDMLPLLEEIADNRAMLDLLQQRAKRSDQAPSRPMTGVSQPSGPVPGAIEWWDFVEGAVESLDSRERLLGEFRRAARRLLRASHAVFFLRDASGFASDRGEWRCSLEDPLVLHLEGHPAVLDGRNPDGPMDPLAELAMRNHLLAWSARLLVPVHDNGRLLGFVALGVRDDGRDYGSDDAERAVGFARLLRQLLLRHEELTQLDRKCRHADLVSKYIPSHLLLGAGEKIPGHVPVPVRDLIGHVRHFGDLRFLEPESGQPYRSQAGPIEESGGVWVIWEDASRDLERLESRNLAERRQLLREVALVLCHEMGNPLVSLSTFMQLPEKRAMPSALIDSMKQDIGQLVGLNRKLSRLHSLEEEASMLPVDIGALAKQLGERMGFKVDVQPNQPVSIKGSATLLDYCLCSLVEGMAEGHATAMPKGMSMQVRSTGGGPDLAALISFKGEGVELEGVFPDPSSLTSPRQGRVDIFIAKEIIRLHRGEIHAGPGISGREIMLTLKSL